VPIHRVDTTELPEERRARIGRAVAGLRTEMAETGPPIGADLEEYTFEIEDGGGGPERLVVTTDRDPSNPTVQRLDELLAALSW